MAVLPLNSKWSGCPRGAGSAGSPWYRLGNITLVFKDAFSLCSVQMLVLGVRVGRSRSVELNIYDKLSATHINGVDGMVLHAGTWGLLVWIRARN